MASSKISADSVIEVNVDRNTGYTTASSGGTLQIYGKLVTLSAVMNTSLTGTNLTLLAIPSKYAPSNDWWLSCDYYHDGSAGWGEPEAWVANDGQIKFNIQGSGNNKDYKLSGAWILN